MVSTRAADACSATQNRIKQMSTFSCRFFLCLPLFSLQVGVQHPKHPLVTFSQGFTARKASPSSSSPPCTEHSITSAARHQAGTLTYFPTSSHCAVSSCEHRNKDDSSKKMLLLPPIQSGGMTIILVFQSAIYPLERRGVKLVEK